MDADTRVQLRTLTAAAVLLVGGWITFWAGAINPFAARFFLPMPVDQYLQSIDTYRTAWLAIAGAFAVGVLLTAAGLVLLSVVLRTAGDRVWSELGRAAFMFGAVLWLVSIGFRATVTVAAAREMVSTGGIPSWFEPMRDWSGALFAVYMLLAYFATAAFGKSMLITGVGPRWLARAHVAFGLVAAAGFLARVPLFNPPLLIHLFPGMLGVMLLRTRARERAIHLDQE